MQAGGGGGEGLDLTFQRVFKQLEPSGPEGFYHLRIDLDNGAVNVLTYFEINFWSIKVFHVSPVLK